MRYQNWLSKINWFILLLFIFLPRLLNLDAFLTIDEPLFLNHARQFARSLATGDLAQTIGIGYPGVTTAAAAAWPVSQATTLLGAYAAGRFAVAVMNGLLLLALYGVSRGLLGRQSAFIGVLLLALDPFFMGYSRLLHNEVTLALTITLAGMSLLRWLNQPQRRWLVLTGIFTGLALLTKSTALALGPLLVVEAVSWGLVTRQWRSGRWWKQIVLSGLAATLLAGVVFLALWPAMWVNPVEPVALTLSKLFTDRVAGVGNYGDFWLGQPFQAPGAGFYPLVFVLKTTPWLLLGLGLSLWLVIKYPVSKNTPYAITLLLWLFALAYLVIMTIASKKAVRYILPAWPIFHLLAGLALVAAFQHVNEWQKKRQRQGIIGRVLSVTFNPQHSQHAAPYYALSLLPLLFALIYHPYYLTYYNPLVLGWRWAPEVIQVGWGEGLDQAGRYLQNQPGPNVSAWYNSIFPLFYQGQVKGVIPAENLLTADHAVLYINQVQRNIPDPNLIHYFRARRRPEYTAQLNGIAYTWVYPGPIAALNRPDPTPAYPLGGEFGGEARLLGYDLHPQPRSGDPLVVTLYWRALAVPPADRFVYLRLVDPAGHIWAKADSPPVMGFWPSTRWQPGMLIEDAQELPLPPGTPPGVYRLEAGLYDPATGHVLPATGQTIGPGGGLLLGEVPVEWQALTTAPALPHQTDTPLAPQAHLIGYDAPPPAAVTGDVLPLRLVWRETGLLFSFGTPSSNSVLFEWRPVLTPTNTPPPAQQLDKLPWPLEKWGRGAVLLSQHDLIAPPALAAGQYDIAVMLSTGSNPDGDALVLGRVEVTTPPHQFDLPAEALLPGGPSQLAPEVALAGFAVNRSGPALNLRLYWRTGSVLTTRYKIFAQLLAADNSLAAQSDSFPANGQRPTTGWLPGEIITDAHTLTLPADLPAGSYWLIAGLYNPANGQRLSLVNGAGDAILVTEVIVP